MISMEKPFSRTELLLGSEAMEKLRNTRVAVFGVGGVGGYVVEALARSGVGALDLIDADTVSISNLNRQIIATVDTIGQLKTEAAKARVLSINPECHVTTYPIFYLPETADQIDFSKFDYIVDAVDTITAKLDIIMKAKALDIPIISAMGAGNKLDPTRFEIADLYETSVCPLAKVMRYECRKRGIKDLKVVYSKELPHQSLIVMEEEVSNALGKAAGKDELSGEQSASETDAEQKKEKKPFRKRIPASIAFVPSAAGLIIASEIVSDLVSVC